jgi:hypothetical protein
MSPAAKFGGDERNRTADLLRAKQSLSLLSYTPGHCDGQTTTERVYKTGGHRWTRTIDLTLIRRAL